MLPHSSAINPRAGPAFSADRGTAPRGHGQPWHVRAAPHRAATLRRSAGQVLAQRDLPLSHPPPDVPGVIPSQHAATRSPLLLPELCSQRQCRGPAHHSATCVQAPRAT